MTIAIFIYLLIGLVFAILWLVGVVEDEHLDFPPKKLVLEFFRITFLWLFDIILDIILEKLW